MWFIFSLLQLLIPFAVFYSVSLALKEGKKTTKTNEMRKSPSRKGEPAPQYFSRMKAAIESEMTPERFLKIKSALESELEPKQLSRIKKANELKINKRNQTKTYPQEHVNHLKESLESREGQSLELPALEKQLVRPKRTAQDWTIETSPLRHQKVLTKNGQQKQDGQIKALNKRQLRNAMIYKEILDKPLCLRK